MSLMFPNTRSRRSHEPSITADCFFQVVLWSSTPTLFHFMFARKLQRKPLIDWWDTDQLFSRWSSSSYRWFWDKDSVKLCFGAGDFGASGGDRVQVQDKRWGFTHMCLLQRWLMISFQTAAAWAHYESEPPSLLNDHAETRTRGRMRTRTDSFTDSLPESVTDLLIDSLTDS